MKHYHKISIVTISYNQGSFLEQTLKSAFDQNYPNLEYILIDAGSTDNTHEIIARYKDKIAYTVSEKDNGPSDGLNKGFSKATGEIFYYLNSDDMLLPGSLDFFNDYYTQNPGYDVYYGHCLIEMHNPLKVYKAYSDKWDTSLFMTGQITMLQPSTFFRGEFFSKHLKFNTENDTGWDGELLADAAIHKAKFLRFNKMVSLFRLYPDSISGTNSEERNKRFRFQTDRYYDRMRAAGYSKVSKSGLSLKFTKFLRDPVIMIKRIFSINNRIIKNWKRAYTKAAQA